MMQDGTGQISGYHLIHFYIMYQTLHIITVGLINRKLAEHVETVSIFLIHLSTPAGEGFENVYFIFKRGMLRLLCYFKTHSLL